MDIKDVVACYIQHRRKLAAEEYGWFANRPTLKEAILCAALARYKGVKHPHQRRIKQEVLDESWRRLLASRSTITKTKSFKDLHQTVKSIIQPIPGIGALTVYDTALRIGAKLKLEPKAVFIHAGARIGAKKLGLDTSQESIAVTAFPSAFKKLKPREIEDALCVCRDCLNGSSTPTAPNLCICRGRGVQKSEKNMKSIRCNARGLCNTRRTQ